MSGGIKSVTSRALMRSMEDAARQHAKNEAELKELKAEARGVIEDIQPMIQAARARGEAQLAIDLAEQVTELLRAGNIHDAKRLQVQIFHARDIINDARDRWAREKTTEGEGW